MDPPPDLRLSSCFHTRCEGSRPHLWPPLTHLRPHAGKQENAGLFSPSGAVQRPGLPATTKLMVGIPLQLTPWPFASPWAGRANGPFLGRLSWLCLKFCSTKTCSTQSPVELLLNLAPVACCSYLHTNLYIHTRTQHTTAWLWCTISVSACNNLWGTI